jgi:hypothetical protein
MVTTFPPLYEYIYSDIKRINSYLDQIAPDLNYDKIPEWSASLSFTGPKLSSSQKIQPRQLTLHEQVVKIIEYLKKHNYLSESPNHNDIVKITDSEEFILTPFVIQRMKAIKVIIPFKSKQETGESIAIWIHSNIGVSSICLIEDFLNDDIKSFYSLCSGYSSLIGLLMDQKNIIRSTILSEQKDFSNLQNKDHYKDNFMNDYHDIMNKYSRRDPIDVLADVGCQIVSPCRDIETLYRIRESSHNGCGIHIFGYPIFIRDVK